MNTPWGQSDKQTKLAEALKEVSALAAKLLYNYDRPIQEIITKALAEAEGERGEEKPPRGTPKSGIKGI